MSELCPTTPFALLEPPYRQLRSLPEDGPSPSTLRSVRGKALVWSLAKGRPSINLEIAANRARGLALIAILPPAGTLANQPHLLDLLESCRPSSLLPYHPTPDSGELAQLLARPLQDVATEVVDYLSWRGLRLKGETRHLVKKTLDLAGDLRTVAGLSRALFVSRRALGRRFLLDGLPVPSHWLQFGRLLRLLPSLQHSNDSLFGIATRSGYADGFALSNQMHRLTGVRPSTVRECLGWEWFVEAWLDTEVSEGGMLLPPTIPHVALMALGRRSVSAGGTQPLTAAVAEERRR